VNPTRWDDPARDDACQPRTSAPLIRGVLWPDLSARFLNLMGQSKSVGAEILGNTR
jgi:hypothetical protein